MVNVKGLLQAYKSCNSKIPVAASPIAIPKYYCINDGTLTSKPRSEISTSENEFSDSKL